jgi:hypothetical protein
MAKRFSGGMHGRDVRYYFKHDAMDFFSNGWLAQYHGGTAIGECFSTAARISDGDPESWASSWKSLAKIVERRAWTSLSQNHLVSARESFFRAYTYYLATVCFLCPIEEEAQYRENISKARDCFQKGVDLLDSPIEKINIPFHNKKMPGFFLKPDHTNKKRKT